MDKKRCHFIFIFKSRKKNLFYQIGANYGPNLADKINYRDILYYLRAIHKRVQCTIVDVLCSYFKFRTVSLCCSHLQPKCSAVRGLRVSREKRGRFRFRVKRI